MSRTRAIKSWINLHSRKIGCTVSLVIGFGLITTAHTIVKAQKMTISSRGYSQGQWPEKVEQALTNAGANRAELVSALQKAPHNQREGMRFMIENMPLSDLQTLTSKYLLDNVALAYMALDKAPWKSKIPRDVFLNDILPYSSLNEKRDDWRKLLREKAEPLIADCRTPAEVAQRLNEKLFPLLNAKYSTERKRPDQSPLETIESGKATCSGLSILLVDACRAVGVPARVVGTPLWTNLRGNHTWVEIWDGDWHFTGAAEPDSNGLDHGWFVQDASQARKELPQHAIYASSFKQTGLAFPLVWAEDIKWVNAVNVTDRYTRKVDTMDASKTRVLVRVVDTAGKRVIARVSMQEVAKKEVAVNDKILAGVSKGESADLNDMLAFEVYRACPPREYQIAVDYDGLTVRQTCKCGLAAQEFVEISTNGTLKLQTVPAPSTSAAATPRKTKSNSAAQIVLASALTDRFSPDTEKKVAAQKRLASLPLNEMTRDMAWQAYKASAAHETVQQEFAKKIVSTSDRTSPYLWRHVGTKPKDGWALVIAMHGGGNAPKEVNDQQWEGMFTRYYKEHPEAGGYVYLALRAPNDTWNGFYDDSICPLVERLIQQFAIFDDVNPDKVYTLGASHGGYGAFVIGPKIPYRFAAVHASASAPSDGETMGENLRDVRFTFMVGEQDTAYGRADRCRNFAKQVEAWRTQYGGFPGEFELEKNTGHFVPDHDKLAEMLQYKRDAWPKQIVWTQSDNVLKHFYWIEAINPVAHGHIEAKVEGNTITIKTEKQDKLALWLDSTLVDLKRPITVEMVGDNNQIVKKQVFKVKPTLETYCLGLEQTADPHMAAPVRIAL